MNHKTDKIWHSMSDEAIEKSIGQYVRKVRQQQSKTQEEIAKAANISRSTLSLLERGDSGNLKTLIQVLRVLDKLGVMEMFTFKETLSPLALAKAQHRPKERVRKSQKGKPASIKKKSSW